jgi:cobalt-zinc-cadmium efflux system outer membrane protein
MIVGAVFVRRKAHVLFLIGLLVLSGHRAAFARSATVAPDAGARSVRSPNEVHAATTGEPTGILTLQDTLALAVSRSPELGVFPYELRAADALALQVGLRPNPELEVEIEEFAGSGDRSGFDGAETSVRIGQPIELGGKRAKRVRVAQLDRELTQWDYESARLDVIRDATQAFIAVVAAQDRLALAQKVVELSQQAHSAVAQRIEAGRDPPVDELRASVVLSTSRIELQKAERALRTARWNLAAVWGGRGAAFERAADDLDGIAPPALPRDIAAAIAANPDVARWQTQQQRQRAALQLEKANAVPDVTLGGGVQRFEETDDSALVFGLSVPLPLFDRNQGGIRQAVAELGKIRKQHEAVQVRTLAALSEAVGALAAADEEVTILRNDVLPKAEQALATADEGYRQGKFDYLYVLDTQRTLFETQAGYIDAVEAYRRAQADVQRLVGEPSADTSRDSIIAVPRSSSQEDSHEE